MGGVFDSVARVDSVILLAHSAYQYFTDIQGINLTETQKGFFQVATSFQNKAFMQILSAAKDSLIYYLNKALENYQQVDLKPMHTIFFDDFENGINDWTHGGINDEWESGTPSNVGPSTAYSGINCWGTNLDSVYRNNADCWLLSPSVNLNGLSCAYLNVKIYNDVEDSLQGYSPKDRLWVEASTDDGNTFFTITTHLGGVIDYNTGVPQVGGWSRLVLDLTPYVGSLIRIRFHFTSNSSVTRPGSYIDDVSIYGRDLGAQGVEEHQNNNYSVNFYCYPNPSSGMITIDISGINEDNNLTLSDIGGQELMRKEFKSNKIQIDISNLVKGIYFLKLQNEHGMKAGKIVKE